MPQKRMGTPLPSVPHPRGLVPGSGDNARSVRAKRCGADDILVPCEDDRHAFAIGAPDPRSLVPEAVTMRAPSGLNDAELTLPW